MGIFNDGDKVQQWRYHVSEIMLLIPGEDKIVIPVERLNGMNIIDDFENNAFPLFKIELVLESSIYYKLLKNKNTEKIHLRVDKYFLYVDDSTPSYYQKFINDNFDLIMDEDTDDILKSLKEDENKFDYTSKIKSDKDELEKVDNKISLYLFKTDIIGGTKKNVNVILQNCNVTDAITYVSTQGNIKNILMAQPDNVTKYDTLMIPSMSVLKAYSFIDTYYGLYQEGSIIYFGLNYTYIIPYNGKCEAYTSNEIQNISIIVPKSNNATHSVNTGSLKKKVTDKFHYIIANYNSIGGRNESISNNYLEANNMKAIDVYSGEVNESSSDGLSKDGNFTRIYENKTENPFIASAYTAQTNAKSMIIDVRLENFDFTDFSPNKRFNVIFEDSNYTKKYKGNYILTYASHSFISEGADFALNSVITFKKEK